MKHNLSLPSAINIKFCLCTGSVLGVHLYYGDTELLLEIVWWLDTLTHLGIQTKTEKIMVLFLRWCNLKSFLNYNIANIDNLLVACCELVHGNRLIIYYAIIIIILEFNWLHPLVAPLILESAVTDWPKCGWILGFVQRNCHLTCST